MVSYNDHSDRGPKQISCSSSWSSTANIYRSSKINENNIFITFVFKVRYETQLGLNTSNLPREKWDTWDPTLISEV